MSPGDAAVFLLIAVLAGAVLWRGRFPFWARAGQDKRRLGAVPAETARTRPGPSSSAGTGAAEFPEMPELFRQGC
jgi:hypothetical protein